jgi:hypothetical protein
MSKETAPEVVTSDGGYSQPALLRLERFKGKWTGGLGKRGRMAVIWLVIVILVIAGYMVYKRVTDHNITIGKTVITPQTIQELSNEITGYTKLTHAHFDGSPQHVAGDDLILNAALKDQAAKHNIRVTQADIDFANAQKYQSHGSRAGYERYAQAIGIANLTRILSENTAYEAKLNDTIIAKKDLFIVAIGYDTPYFNSSKDPAALRKQATKILQTKFLPLFKQGKNETQIAAQTDLNYTLNDPKINTSAYTLLFTGMPSMAANINNCTTATPCFNDAQVGRFASIPGIKSTAAEIARLTQVGQYTDVFTYKAGFIGIIQLNGQTPGAYNSWDSLLRDYRHRYAPRLAFISSPGGTVVYAYGKEVGA